MKRGNSAAKKSTPLTSKNTKTRSKTNTKILICLSSLVIFTVSSIIVYQIVLNSSESNGESGRSEINYYDLESAVKPFGADEFAIGQVFDKPFWGTLNSGHYFGLKLASPTPIETSLIWFQHVLNKQGGIDIRHLCNQNDGIKSYAWNRHDFYNFGQQIIEDRGYLIKTSFVKNPSNHLEWRAHVEIEISNSHNEKLKPLSVIQYITTTHQNDRLNIENGNVDDSSFVIKGFSNDIKNFKMSIKFNSGKEQLLSRRFVRGSMDKNRVAITSYIGSKLQRVLVNGTNLFEIKNSKQIRHQYDLEQPGEPNIVAYQMNVRGPCNFYITMTEDKNSESGFLKYESYQLELQNRVSDFDSKFSSKFNLNNARLGANQTIDDLDKLSKVSLSNMLGSVGYFYGVSVIGANSVDRKILPYGPIELLTGVPSRSFFPRGFLWDEAFHNLLISHWNPELSNKIIKSWFNIMNTNGWIPREVILGVESMNRVPREFLVQYITNANPPAMFIVLDRMFQQKALEPSTLEHIYPRLKTWYRWFDATQTGIIPTTYRWRGRDELSVNLLNPKTLTSGLDDYPRSSHPSPQEYHVDLRCWMTLALSTLTKFAEQKGDEPFLNEIKPRLDELRDQVKLDKLHWSDEHRMYCDFGHNTQDVELVKVTKYRNKPYGDGVEPYQEYQRMSKGHPEFGCVPEFGYNSLFPLIFNIIEPDSDKLGILLDRLTDEEELWSPYGIRSLSKKSKYYNKYNSEHDRPYWRGAVWINLNYLILSSLHKYSHTAGPYAVRCQTIFEDLRQNLVNNVLSDFKRTDYIWEQYNDQTGQGQGSHPFTGWSSLVSMIVSSDWSINKV